MKPSRSSAAESSVSLKVSSSSIEPPSAAMSTVDLKARSVAITTQPSTTPAAPPSSTMYSVSS